MSGEAGTAAGHLSYYVRRFSQKEGGTESCKDSNRALSVLFKHPNPGSSTVGLLVYMNSDLKKKLDFFHLQPKHRALCIVH